MRQPAAGGSLRRKAYEEPTFLLPGIDTPHPAATSAELAALLPGVEVLTDRRGSDHLEQQRDRMVKFLKVNTPVR